MERRRHRQNHRALRPELRRNLGCALNRACMARNYGLLRRIQIRRRTNFTLRRALAGIGYDGMRNPRSEEHTSELQSPCNLVCRLLLEKKKERVLKGSTRMQWRKVCSASRAAYSDPQRGELV